MQMESSGGKRVKVRRAIIWGVPVVLVLVFAILGLTMLFSPRFHALHGTPELSEEQKRLLTELGIRAAKNGEVPLAAIMLNQVKRGLTGCSRIAVAAAFRCDPTKADW